MSAAPSALRKPSVSIEEPSRPLDSPSSTKIPAASQHKIDPAKTEEQLRSSIPAKEIGIVKGWKVKQVVITKLDSGASGAAVAGVNVAPGAGAGPPMLGKLKKQGTSKMHKFT